MKYLSNLPDRTGQDLKNSERDRTTSSTSCPVQPNWIDSGKIPEYAHGIDYERFLILILKRKFWGTDERFLCKYTR